MATSEPRQTKKNQPVRLVFLQIDDLPEFIWSGRRESNTTPNPLFETRFFLFAQWEKTILCTAHLPLASKVVYQGLLTSLPQPPTMRDCTGGYGTMASSSRKTSAEIPGKVIDHLCGRVPYRNRFCPSTARNDVDWMVMPGHLLSAVVQGLARPAQCSQVTCRFAEWPEKRMLLTRLGIDLSNATSLLWNVL